MNIVITGASKGVGYYTALNLAKKRENKIFALSRDVAGLKRLSDSVDSENIITVPCDITDEKSIGESIQKIRETVLGIEVLINNAGLLIKKPFLELTSADWQAIYNVNVFGVVNITRALFPMLMEGSIFRKTNVRSHIVNISSMGGVQGSVKFNGLSAYSSSKSALIGISECLSEEYKTKGVYVNSIALGSVETEMFQKAFPGMKASAEVEEISAWLADFALNGFKFFNGKVIPVSNSTP